jgi:hypothetical protein
VLTLPEDVPDGKAISKQMRCKQGPSHTAFVAPFSASKVDPELCDLPNQITADLGTPFCFFSNPLMLREGYGQSDFDVHRALAPSLRATNAGFVVVTIEHDCHSRGHFEEIASWSSASGRFRSIDAELRKYKDYCGYSVVFSGRRSIYFHFVFDTSHIIEAPFDANYTQRWPSREQQSAIVHNVLSVYWDCVNDLMNQNLAPSLDADKSLRDYTKFRRTPWRSENLIRLRISWACQLAQKCRSSFWLKK